MMGCLPFSGFARCGACSAGDGSTGCRYGAHRWNRATALGRRWEWVGAVARFLLLQRADGENEVGHRLGLTGVGDEVPVSGDAYTDVACLESARDSCRHQVRFA